VVKKRNTKIINIDIGGAARVAVGVIYN